MSNSDGIFEIGYFILLRAVPAVPELASSSQTEVRDLSIMPHQAR
jgi:hypothetical protein